MSLSNVSSRLRAAREFAGLSGRALDRLASRPEGTAAIIEGRNAEGMRRHVAESYANVLGVELAWLMLGIGPLLAERPDLDPDCPEHLAEITTRVSVAVERARTQRVDAPVCELVPDLASAPLATGTGG